MADQTTARLDKVPNACNECRKKRTKCDGELPCSRCQSRQGLVCVYEPHLKQTKEVIQAELVRIRREWQSMDAVLRHLMSYDRPEIVLDQLRSGTPLESIAEFSHSRAISDKSFTSSNANLASSFKSDAQVPTRDNFASRSSTSIGRASSSPPQSDIGKYSHGYSPKRSEDFESDPARHFLQNRQSVSDHEYQRRGEFPSARWTAVTSDNSLVDHLLALYFCWEYPTFASMSKEHFILDFNSGTPRFCTSLLVNAILALGARSSDAPEARKVPTDPRSAGEHFFEEAKRLLGSEEVPTLPTIQALGIMSLRQASCGKDASSFFYARQSLRMAIDIDLHRKHPASRVNEPTIFSRAEREVRTATFWGCFNLEQAWSLCIGRPSQIAPGDIEINKPDEVDEIEHEDWKPYTDTGTILRDYHQPNNVRSVYRCFSVLSEIINHGVYQLYSHSHQIESQKLLSTYHNLLEWYDALPDQLRLGKNFTPTVLFTHMYYHFAVLMLFRPFRDLYIAGSTTSPRSICSEAAQNLFVLIKSYKDLYTLRRVPSFVPYMVLTANLANLVDLAFDPDGVASKSTEIASLSYLEEMCLPHDFAQRALYIVSYFTELWGVDSREDCVRTLRHRQQGLETANHPANDISGTDTFFLPASRSSIESRSRKLQVKNFAIYGPIILLFPQQGRQFGHDLDQSFRGEMSHEDQMSE